MKKNNYIVYIVMSLIAMIATGCYEVEDFYNVPEAVTPDLISIESNRATLNGVSGDNIRYRISTSPDFPEDNTRVVWNPVFDNLESNTRYYFQIMLRDTYYNYSPEEYSIYGEMKSFVTSPWFGITYNDEEKSEIKEIFASSERGTPLMFKFQMHGKDASFVEAGFCLDTDPGNLTIDKSKVVKKGEVNEKNNEVKIESFYDDKLPHGAAIYVCPYVTTSGGTYYGEKNDYVFIASGYVGDNPYIDLGLPSGKKWFACYLGYTQPVGDVYIYSNEYYVEIPFDLVPDGCSVPRMEDAKEIFDNCTSDYVYLNGKNIKATGPNGNVIYFPLRGYRNYYYQNISSFKYGYVLIGEGHVLLDGKYEEDSKSYQRVYYLTEELGLSGYYYHRTYNLNGYNVRFVKD